MGDNGGLSPRTRSPEGRAGLASVSQAVTHPGGLCAGEVADSESPRSKMCPVEGCAGVTSLSAWVERPSREGSPRPLASPPGGVTAEGVGDNGGLSPRNRTSEGRAGQAIVAKVVTHPGSLCAGKVGGRKSLSSRIVRLEGCAGVTSLSERECLGTRSRPPDGRAGVASLSGPP